MAKYDPLGAYLGRRESPEIELAFEEVERIIGSKLPDTASRPQWWANETSPDTRHVQCRAWGGCRLRGLPPARQARAVSSAGGLTMHRGCEPRWTSASPSLSGPRRKRRGRWLLLLSVWGTAALIGTAYGAGWSHGTGRSDQAQGAASGERVTFRYCFIGGGYDCVVDGDTIWLKGVKIRVADIDAPETHDPRCASEKELGDRATRRLHDLLESGPITLKPIDRAEDAYGRKLRIVLVNGKSVGDMLVSEGLARYCGHGRRPSC